MFLCSQCGRPARVLYARYFSDRIWFFTCRKCAGITYQFTMGHRWDRSARRVEKLRARLQWSANAKVPMKPRGMHERRTNESSACSPTTKLFENRERATFGNTDPISTALIWVGSVDTGLWRFLWRLVNGQAANLHLGSTQGCAGRSQDWIKVKNPDAPRQGDRGGVTPAHPVVT